MVFYFDDNFGLMRFRLPDGNRLGLTLCRLAMFGKAVSNVHLETQTSKQLNDSYIIGCPNIAKRLLAPRQLFFKFHPIPAEAFTSFFSFALCANS